MSLTLTQFAKADLIYILQHGKKLRTMDVVWCILKPQVSLVELFEIHFKVKNRYILAELQRAILDHPDISTDNLVGIIGCAQNIDIARLAWKKLESLALKDNFQWIIQSAKNVEIARKAWKKFKKIAYLKDIKHILRWAKIDDIKIEAWKMIKLKDSIEDLREVMDYSLPINIRNQIRESLLSHSEATIPDLKKLSESTTEFKNRAHLAILNHPDLSLEDLDYLDSRNTADDIRSHVQRVIVDHPNASSKKLLYLIN
jgi:hypothetical protein